MESAVLLQVSLVQLYRSSQALTPSLGTTGAATTSPNTSATGAATSTNTLASTSTSSSCAAATSVVVTFNEKVTTTYGETIKIVGNNAQLGNWATGSAVTLSATEYTSSDPLWFVTLSVAPGEVIQYKYINVDSSGTVTWEADPNHTYTVPATCSTAAIVNDTWQ